jgi:hypothetical protein
MTLTEQDIKTYFRVLAVLNEGLEEYGEWMAKIEADPVAAGTEFMERLRRAPKSVKMNRLIQQLQGILDNNFDFFQKGASNQKEALQFLISNTLMSGAKLGVLEDVEDADSLIQQIANDSPETIL